MLCLLFNTMLVHGYTPDDLLKSSIISIPKDSTASLTTSDNLGGSPFLKQYASYLIMLFWCYMEMSYSHQICNLGINKVIQQLYALYLQRSCTSLFKLW